jgi:hypothetical protein
VFPATVLSAGQVLLHGSGVPIRLLLPPRCLASVVRMSSLISAAHRSAAASAMVRAAACR